MQKEIYEKPDMEVIMMDYEAVITDSNPTPGKGETPIDPANLMNDFLIK